MFSHPRYTNFALTLYGIRILNLDAGRDDLSTTILSISCKTWLYCHK